MAKLVIVAVVAAALGAGVTYAVTKPKPAESPATVAVVVATEDMATGHRITADELRIISVPEDQVVPNAATELQKLIGQRPGEPIYQNQQITWTALECRPPYCVA